MKCWVCYIDSTVLGEGNIVFLPNNTKIDVILPVWRTNRYHQTQVWLFFHTSLLFISEVIDMKAVGKHTIWRIASLLCEQTDKWDHYNPALSSRVVLVRSECVWGCESAYVTSKNTEKPWRLLLYSVMWLVVGQQQHNLRWMPTGCCKHKSCSFDLRTGCNVFASNIKVQWVTCCFSSWMFVDYIHINSWLSKS